MINKLRLLPDMLEAFLSLTLARLIISGPGGKKVLSQFPVASNNSHHSVSEEVEAEAKKVARLLKASARRLPWKSNCLVQSLAATRMLKRRKVPALLYIGVRTENQANLKAHAWVRVGNIDVCGGGIHKEEFKILSLFTIEN